MLWPLTTSRYDVLARPDSRDFGLVSSSLASMLGALSFDVDEIPVDPGCSGELKPESAGAPRDDALGSIGYRWRAIGEEYRCPNENVGVILISLSYVRTYLLTYAAVRGRRSGLRVPRTRTFCGLYTLLAPIISALPTETDRRAVLRKG